MPERTRPISVSLYSDRSTLRRSSLRPWGVRPRLLQRGCAEIAFPVTDFDDHQHGERVLHRTRAPLEVETNCDALRVPQPPFCHVLPP